MDCSARDFNTQNIHHYYYSAIAVSHLAKHPVPRPSPYHLFNPSSKHSTFSFPYPTNHHLLCCFMVPEIIRPSYDCFHREIWKGVFARD